MVVGDGFGQVWSGGLAVPPLGSLNTFMVLWSILAGACGQWEPSAWRKRVSFDLARPPAGLPNP
jgi:hypothetical protein